MAEAFTQASEGERARRITEAVETQGPLDGAEIIKAVRGGNCGAKVGRAIRGLERSGIIRWDDTEEGWVSGDPPSRRLRAI